MSSDVGTGPMPTIEQRCTAQPAPSVGERGVGRTRWESRYTLVAVIADTLVVMAGCAIGGLLSWRLWGVPAFPIATGLAVTAELMTMASLGVWRAWEPRVLGQGSEEFSRILRGTVTSLVLLGLAGLAFELRSVRPWAFVLIPLIGLALAASRYRLRRRLHRKRMAGTCLHRVLAVGTPQSIAELVFRTREARHFGWEVVGACTANGLGFERGTDVAGVPVVGDLEALPRLVAAGGYRVVAVTPMPDWSPRRLQALSWELEDSSAEIVVDPGMLEVAGPRLHVKPVDGLPMLRLTEPRFSGIAHVMKGAFDRCAALLLIMALLPFLAGVAVAVKLDGGPVFFRQIRVGKDGRTFRMVKFRSMVVDAERLRGQLLMVNEGAGPLFKIRCDPRVTRVGQWIRRYSVDELPQLLNVLHGSMSLVGPRPPLPDEVCRYSRETRRRLHVRPGLTGLWQVSGRSNLSWEESVRLDLRYVENWSLALDALILWKTVGAVLNGDGAY